jgi:acetyltransferase
MSGDDPVTAGQIFNPRSIAIIGASADPGKFAGKVTANALRSARRSEREVYLVNPNRSAILDHPAYPSIADVPGDVDQAYIAVPAPGVIAQLEAADRAGIGLATIFSGGFGESGNGPAQAELADALRRLRIRAIGPNCNGLINVFDSLAVTSSSVPYLDLIPGPLAVISHSGALGQVNGLQRASALGIGAGLQLSCGNAVDLHEVELIEHAFADPRIKVVVAILERVTDGTRLLRIASRVRAEGKLLIVVKLGQSAAGKSAIMGHTGEALGDDALARGLLRDAAALVVEDIDQALECADLWAKNPGLAGDRVASVSLSGGNLAYFVDACAVRGVTHPEFPAEIKTSLAAVLPPLAVVSNPVDLSSAADVARDQGAKATSVLPAVLSVLGGSGQDVITAILTLPPDSDLQALKAIDLDELGSPLIVIWAGDSREAKTSRLDLRQAGLTVFENAISCAQALQLFRTGTDQAKAAVISTDRSWPLEQARRELRAAGLRFPAGAVVSSEDEACAVAAKLGYPVAVKSAAAGLLHKAAMGGVVLGPATETDVRLAYLSVVRAARRHGLGDPGQVLVEELAQGELAQPDRALFLSVVSDESFGPVLLIGKSRDADQARADLAVAALDVVGDAGLHRLVRAALGAERAAACEAILAAIKSVNSVAARADVELVEINPLFVGDASVLAVDCVVITRSTG